MGRLPARLLHHPRGRSAHPGRPVPLPDGAARRLPAQPGHPHRVRQHRLRRRLRRPAPPVRRGLPEGSRGLIAGFGPGITAETALGHLDIGARGGGLSRTTAWCARPATRPGSARTRRPDPRSSGALRSLRTGGALRTSPWPAAEEAPQSRPGAPRTRMSTRSRTAAPDHPHPYLYHRNPADPDGLHSPAMTRPSDAVPRSPQPLARAAQILVGLYALLDPTRPKLFDATDDGLFYSRYVSASALVGLATLVTFLLWFRRCRYNAQVSVGRPVRPHTGLGGGRLVHAGTDVVAAPSYSSTSTGPSATTRPRTPPSRSSTSGGRLGSHTRR